MELDEDDSDDSDLSTLDSDDSSESESESEENRILKKKYNKIHSCQKCRLEKYFLRISGINFGGIRKLSLYLLCEVEFGIRSN